MNRMSDSDTAFDPGPFACGVQESENRIRSALEGQAAEHLTRHPSALGPAST